MEEEEKQTWRRRRKGLEELDKVLDTNIVTSTRERPSKQTYIVTTLTTITHDVKSRHTHYKQ